MKNLSWFISKLARVRDLPRYAFELSAYMRGYATAKTLWGDHMRVPFPEFRSIVQKGYITGHGEESVYAYFDSHLTGKDVFFDIGANAGFYTLLANHTGARVYSFEPFPTTFELLRENIERNCDPARVTLFPYAVSEHKGTLHMLEKHTAGINHISADGNIPVQTVTLDELQIVPTVLKVDVEGHEMSVFKGARTMLRKYMPVIVAEVSAESRDYLVSLGYKATLLGKTNYLFTK
ncbi:MAG: FkbM family methyltransferase [Candidatus Kaiserbacteria bacterium]|nr:FkbM family methyltransferase [Candidatus Kaiserbacteria bacterium]